MTEQPFSELPPSRRLGRFAFRPRHSLAHALAVGPVGVLLAAFAVSAQPALDVTTPPRSDTRSAAPDAASVVPSDSAHAVPGAYVPYTPLFFGPTAKTSTGEYGLSVWLAPSATLHAADTGGKEISGWAAVGVTFTWGGPPYRLADLPQDCRPRAGLSARRASGADHPAIAAAGAAPIRFGEIIPKAIAIGPRRAARTRSRGGADRVRRGGVPTWGRRAPVRPSCRSAVYRVEPTRSEFPLDFARVGVAPSLLSRSAMTTREIRDITVGELMSKPVTVTPETTIEQLTALMGQHDFNAFPVVNEVGTLLGLVTRLDLFRLYLLPYARFIPAIEDTWVSSVGAIMSRGVIALSARESAMKAIALMVEHGIRTIPIVADTTAGQTVVGVVTRRDLTAALGR